MDKQEIYDKLIACGVSDLDAKILLDCCVTGKGCSWVNVDEPKPDAEPKLNEFMAQFGVRAKIEHLASRGSKYIWDVKGIKRV
ncbi:MAG: hypothetical protein ACP5NX_01235 [Candidatus Bilamarchaeaceae archaeon]